MLIGREPFLSNESLGQPGGDSAGLAERISLNLGEQCIGEAVVEFGEIDVGRPHPGGASGPMAISLAGESARSVCPLLIRFTPPPQAAPEPSPDGGVGPYPGRH